MATVGTELLSGLFHTPRSLTQEILSLLTLIKKRRSVEWRGSFLTKTSFFSHQKTANMNPIARKDYMMNKDVLSETTNECDVTR